MEVLSSASHAFKLLVFLFKVDFVMVEAHHVVICYHHLVVPLMALSKVILVLYYLLVESLFSYVLLFVHDVVQSHRVLRAQFEYVHVVS